MFKYGSLIISSWIFFNLIISLAILINIVFLNGTSPAIDQILSADDVNALPSKVLTSIDSIAIYANGLNIAFCLLAQFVIQSQLSKRKHWAFWSLLTGLSAAFLAGMAADIHLGTVRPDISFISASILLLGFGATAIGLFRKTESAGSVVSA